MAEISYPFDTDSAGGGSQLVSQVQWQNMTHMFGADRIDFQMVNASYQSQELPFHTTISEQDIIVQPGRAWNGGFYYVLDAPWTYPVPTNSGAQPRIDLIVLRTDITAGSVNLALKQGQAATQPQEPPVQRVPGGIWETPICAIRCEANNGARTLLDRRRFDGPGRIYVPWNAKEVTQSMSWGGFGVDMDANQNDTQYEAFLGRDGYMVARHLGKRRSYTPDVFAVSNKPSVGKRQGWWRYIAPGTVSFAISIATDLQPAIASSSAIGITLPIPANSGGSQNIPGTLSNIRQMNDMPNMMSITGRTEPGSQNCYLWYPSPSTTQGGLDALTTLPSFSVLTLSGVYETSDL